MRSFSIFFAAITAAAALLLAGCSMGGSSSGVPGFSKGVITAKGSIFVNGVEFDTRSASITLDDSGSHPDSDLKVGMTVSVKGTIDSSSGKGSAQEIVYAANLEGTIDAPPSLSAGTFAVFGHTIAVDATTVYEGVTDLTGLSAGDRVEISGSADAVSHVIHASRVEKKTTGGDFEIKGVVSSITSSTLVLTPADASVGLTVNFSGTLNPSIANGSFVEVKFSSYSSPLTTTAALIKPLKELKAGDHDKTEVSGVVTNLASSGGTATFTVNGVNISASASLAAGLANGMEVEVKGTMSGGVLVADLISTDHESNIEVVGNASSANTAAGTLTVNGVTLAVNSRTIFRDEGSASPVVQFGLGNISVGDHLEVSAYGDSSVSPAAGVATRVERRPASSSASLGGPVSATSATTLTIAGVTVNTSAATFKDSNGAAVGSQAAFNALITTGTTVVKAKGTWTGSALNAISAEIDN